MSGLIDRTNHCKQVECLGYWVEYKRRFDHCGCQCKLCPAARKKIWWEKAKEFEIVLKEMTQEKGV